MRKLRPLPATYRTHYKLKKEKGREEKKKEKREGDES
jgi:hypothetical protein